VTTALLCFSKNLKVGIGATETGRFWPGMHDRKGEIEWKKWERKNGDEERKDRPKMKKMFFSETSLSAACMLESQLTYCYNLPLLFKTD